MATGIIELIAELGEVVRDVQGNKERCKEIADRAQRLVPALQDVNSSGNEEVSEKENIFFTVV